MKPAVNLSSKTTPAPTVQSQKYSREEFARVQEGAQARLYPSLFASNYLVLSNRRARMQKFFAAHEEVGDVLDVGGQYCPYYPLFRTKCRSYSSLDIVDTPIVDIVCNAENMPISDCSYDVVLCTQVLEHSTNPDLIVTECHRVLREGGTLIVTVPSIYPVHGYPADNWRFMPDGLRHLFRAFSRVEVIGELDFAESLVSVVCHYGHVITGRLGTLGKAANPIWNCSTNVIARTLSYALRPLARNNFDSFSMNLWAEGTK